MFDNRPVVKVIPSSLDGSIVPAFGHLGAKHWNPVVSIDNQGSISKCIPFEVQLLLAEKDLKPCDVPADGSLATLGFEQVSWGAVRWGVVGPCQILLVARPLWTSQFSLLRYWHTV
jgi:hypothetical protein